MRALARQGYDTPTPIQEQAIPIIMDHKDVLGCAQTGTGKTAAFALPILHLLCQNQTQPKQKVLKGRRQQPKDRNIRSLILAPTRELAAQIQESFREYGHYTKLKSAVVFGGVGQYPQVKALQKGIDILIATPGRLMDLFDQGHVDLLSVETLVLDEADRMLDMGFVKDIKRIITYLPDNRQNLLFSATMPKPIKSLANALLHKPISIQVASHTSSAAETVDQHICMIENARKADLLCHLIHHTSVSRAIVFTRTKIRADRLTRSLNREHIEAQAIHSDKSQQARTRALRMFKNGDLHILVASDIAARGVDVDDISHVFNFDMPGDPETYIHRIGRTGRAGTEGTAITFVSEDDEKALWGIERLLKHSIEEMEHPFDKPKFSKGKKKASKKKRARHPIAKSGGKPTAHDNTGPTKPKSKRRRPPAGKKKTFAAGSDKPSESPENKTDSKPSFQKKKSKKSSRRPPRKPGNDS